MQLGFTKFTQFGEYVTLPLEQTGTNFNKSVKSMSYSGLLYTTRFKFGGGLLMLNADEGCVRVNAVFQEGGDVRVASYIRFRSIPIKSRPFSCRP